ncbi:MAG: Sir2 family NAD-dependent protein deacetylase [Alphaproteobacteria bacterium]
MTDALNLRRLIEEATKVVAFTGAGISTESGIPDFRSPGGVWTKYQPIEFSEFMASEDMRRESWRRKFATQSEIGAVEPNRGHRAVAKLAEAGTVTRVITQNIDGLHQQSGVAAEQVIELHGNTTYAVCLDCHQRYELEPIRLAFEADGTLPLCTACDGIVKTATISFGQQMPEAEMLRAEAATLDCNLFLAIGSSLQVFPAAGFPVVAKRNGAKLVILNREATQLDEHADLIINGEIGSTLGDAVGVN